MSGRCAAEPLPCVRCGGPRPDLELVLASARVALEWATAEEDPSERRAWTRVAFTALQRHVEGLCLFPCDPQQLRQATTAAELRELVGAAREGGAP